MSNTSHQKTSLLLKLKLLKEQTDKLWLEACKNNSECLLSDNVYDLINEINENVKQLKVKSDESKHRN